jgi:uncharacterized protein (DUF736 family)
MALIEIGAAWTRHGNGGEFLSLKIGGKPAMAFRNTKKQEGSKQPDYRIVSDDADLVAQFGTEFTPKPQEQQEAGCVHGARPDFACGESAGMDEVPF